MLTESLVMKHILSFCAVFFVFFFAIGSLSAQTDTLRQNIDASRNRNIRHLLDYRFKGGTGSFERLFYNMVEYTPEAKRNCIVGTVILSFEVDCNNNLGDFRMRNPLHSGLNEKLQEFFKATEGQWNSCNEDKYTRFEIPVLFTVAGTETAATGFLVVETSTPGFKCKSDQFYMDQFEKLRKRGKVKRALKSLDFLIRRDPYNQNYYELKRQVLTQLSAPEND
jgi:hypothetical protein